MGHQVPLLMVYDPKLCQQRALSQSTHNANVRIGWFRRESYQDRVLSSTDHEAGNSHQKHVSASCLSIEIVGTIGSASASCQDHPHTQTPRMIPRQALDHCPQDSL